MNRYRFIWASILLALQACHLPVTSKAIFVVGKSTAKLSIHIGGKVLYRLQAGAPIIWTRVRARLTNSHGEEREVVASSISDKDFGGRSADIAFSELEPNDTYSLSVEFEDEHDGNTINVGHLSRDNIILSQGDNPIDISDFEQGALSTPILGTSVFESYVTSIPESGPSGVFRSASALCRCPDGSILLVTLDNLRVLTHINNGLLVRTVDLRTKDQPEKTKSLSQLVGSGDSIVCDRLGNAFLSDKTGCRVYRIEFDSDGRGYFSTIAGTGRSSFKDGTGAEACFESPSSLAIDTNGNLLVSDHARLRQISMGETPETTQVRTVAGTGAIGMTDGAALSATFQALGTLAVSPLGQVVAVDGVSLRLLYNDASSALQVKTIAGAQVAGDLDGNGLDARFSSIQGLSFWQNNVIFTDGQKVKSLSLIEPYKVSTVTGSMVGGHSDGRMNDATFMNPGQVLAGEDSLFLIDGLGSYLRQLDFTTRDVRTVAGSNSVTTTVGEGAPDGPFGTNRLVGDLRCVVEDVPGTYLVSSGSSILKVESDFHGGYDVSTWLGTGSAGYLDGDQGLAQFREPTSIVKMNENNFLVLDRGNNCLRKITKRDNGAVWISTVAGSPSAGYMDGDGFSAKFNLPSRATTGPNGEIYISDTGNNRIRKVIFQQDGHCVVTSVAGSGVRGTTDGPADSAQLDNPIGIAASSDGQVYFLDHGALTKLRRVVGSPLGLAVETVSGGQTPSIRYADGEGLNASFARATDLLIVNGEILISDGQNNRIRKAIFSEDGKLIVSTFAGAGAIQGSPFPAGFSDGPSNQAQFSRPVGMTMASDGSIIIVDWLNRSLRRINRNVDQVDLP